MLNKKQLDFFEDLKLPKIANKQVKPTIKEAEEKPDYDEFDEVIEEPPIEVEEPRERHTPYDPLS